MPDIFEQITGAYDPPETKQCSTCWEVKHLDDFYTSDAGRRASCAECQTLAALDRYHTRKVRQ